MASAEKLLSRFADYVSVSRPAGEWTAAGLWKRLPDDDQALTIRASVQPASPEEMLLLPEGERTRQAVVIYTVSDLQLADQAAARKGDLITWRDRQYEVKARADWGSTRLSHFKYVAQLVEADS